LTLFFICSLLRKAQRSRDAWKVGTMARIFAVMTAHGPQWDAARPLQRQAEWEAHADFMNALEAEGFVLLGGTLDDGKASANAAAAANALLVIRARDEEEVRWRLAADPWAKSGLLGVASVRPWTLRLGEDFETLWVPARARSERPGRRAKQSKGRGKSGSSLPKGRKNSAPGMTARGR
jgi:uncharacterized protein YciI